MKKFIRRVVAFTLCLMMLVQTPIGVWAKTSDFESAESHMILSHGGNYAKEKAQAKKRLYAYKGKSKKVTIPSRFTEICSYAFESNKTIETVIIPKSVKKIGDHAFFNCKNLKKVVFEKGSKITRIEESTFDECKNLKTINLPVSVKKIGSSAFNGCSKLEEIKIPDNVTNISYEAFAYCKSLKTVNLPRKVKSIENEAFSCCTNLEKIEFNGQLKTIGYSAFENCTKLKSIALPVSINLIDYHAFEACTKLEKVSVKGTNGKSGNGTIRKEAFSNCSNLKSIQLPKSISVIEKESFSGCNKIQNITIENENCQLADGIFDGTVWYQDVMDNNKTGILGGILVHIGADLVSSDGTVKIPERVKTIATGVDSGWDDYDDGSYSDYDDEEDYDEDEYEEDDYTNPYSVALKTIVIPTSVKKVNDRAFTTSTIEKVEVASNVELEGNPFRGTTLSRKSLEDTGFFVMNGTLLDTWKTGKVNIPDGVTKINPLYFAEDTSLICPDSLREISDHAFYEQEKLKKITLNKNLKSIGQSAFRLCTGLTSVTLNESLNDIGDAAFKDCFNLKSVTFNKNLTTIGSYAFYNCRIKTNTIDLSKTKQMGVRVFGRVDEDDIADYEDWIGHKIDDTIGKNVITKLVLGKNLKTFSSYYTLNGCTVKNMVVPSYKNGNFPLVNKNCIIMCKKNSKVYKTAKRWGYKCKEI